LKLLQLYAELENIYFRDTDILKIKKIQTSQKSYVYYAILPNQELFATKFTAFA